MRKGIGRVVGWAVRAAVVSGALSLPAALAPADAAEPASSPGLVLQVAGQPELVFDKKRDACEPNDIPDAPARAIRTADGQVQLYAPHFRNRRMVGPDLLHLRTDCRIVFAGSERDDPAAFDDRGWIASLYTLDGRTIYAAIHNEYQGHRRKERCATGRYIDCWYNSITAAVSRDGGLSFRRAAPGSDLIASLPYRYEEVVGHHAGYFNPSNIVPFDGALYMTVFTTQARAQRPGNCLLRTDRIEDPASWRAWDGGGFGATFADPYAGAISDGSHICAPVGQGGLRWPVASLVRHRASGLFVATMLDGGPGGGVFYSTSPDLLRWSKPAKLLDATGESGFRCGDPLPLAYPSLLDPQAPGRIFDTIADSGLLFYTRFDVTNCKTSMERDLMRLRIAVGRGAPATPY
jgi:hypothetical protein